MARVIIVDDSKIAREILKTSLIDIGHEIIAEAKEGIEAIKLFKQLKPDLLTIDLEMPIMGGIETIQTIRNLDKNVKMILITSVINKRDIIIATNKGASAYLKKPLSTDILKLEIENLIGE